MNASVLSSNNILNNEYYIPKVAQINSSNAFLSFVSMLLYYGYSWLLIKTYQSRSLVQERLVKERSLSSFHL